MVEFTEVAEGALATEAATLATLEARAGALAVAFIGRGRRRTSLRQGGRLRIAEATAINVCLCPSGDPARRCLGLALPPAARASATLLLRLRLLSPPSLAHRRSPLLVGDVLDI